MKYGLYSIYDEAAGVFTAPFIELSDEAAMRNFRKMCADAGSIMNFKPSDFSLYAIGVWDAETSNIDSFVPHSRLIIGSSGFEERVGDK